MNRLSNILRSAGGGGVVFKCPGCNTTHAINVGGGPGPSWGYNGDPDKPSFQPSVLVRGIRTDLTPEEEALYDAVFDGTSKVLDDPRFASVCHSFVTCGRIQFLNDCTHALAGQTVDLPEFPHAKWDLPE